MDTGIYEGSEISMFYDPMIAKLVTYGKDRAEALQYMLNALDQYTIRGVSHNIPFLSALMRHEKFVSGDISTAFIEQEYPEGFSSTEVTHADPHLLVAVATAIQFNRDSRDLEISGKIDEDLSAPEKYIAVINDEEISTQVSTIEGGLQVRVAETEYDISSDWKPGEILFNSTINGTRHAIQVDRQSIGWQLTHNGYVSFITIFTERLAELNRLMPVKVPPDLSKFLISPMPGLLVRLNVAEGDKVEAGQELAVIEAMKMENSLLAEQDGIVAKINAAAGDSLAADESILEFE